MDFILKEQILAKKMKCWGGPKGQKVGIHLEVSISYKKDEMSMLPADAKIGNSS